MRDGVRRSYHLQNVTFFSHLWFPDACKSLSVADYSIEEILI